MIEAFEIGVGLALDTAAAETALKTLSVQMASFDAAITQLQSRFSGIGNAVSGFNLPKFDQEIRFAISDTMHGRTPPSSDTGSVYGMTTQIGPAKGSWQQYSDPGSNYEDSLSPLGGGMSVRMPQSSSVLTGVDERSEKAGSTSSVENGFADEGPWRRGTTDVGSAETKVGENSSDRSFSEQAPPFVANPSDVAITGAAFPSGDMGGFLDIWKTAGLSGGAEGLSTNASDRRVVTVPEVNVNHQGPDVSRTTGDLSSAISTAIGSDGAAAPFAFDQLDSTIGELVKRLTDYAAGSVTGATAGSGVVPGLLSNGTWLDGVQAQAGRESESKIGGGAVNGLHSLEPDELRSFVDAAVPPASWQRTMVPPVPHEYLDLNGSGGAAAEPGSQATTPTARGNGGAEDLESGGGVSLVVHTSVELDGDVIGRAVGERMIAWMNGPLGGNGAFDARRSYTPIES